MNGAGSRIYLLTPLNAINFESGVGTQTHTQGARGKASASQHSQDSRVHKVAGDDKENRGLFRKPAKVVKGIVDIDKLLEKRPVMRDIINGI